MCGRYELHSHPEAIALHFGLAELPRIAPRYNVCPQQPVPVVRVGRDGRRQLVMMRWGLVPYWAKDPAIGARTINARAESVADKPAFRDAFRARRCLVPADAFYEWQAVAGRKQPVRVEDTDGRLLGLAGLYDRWRGPDGTAIETCTIVTSEANARLASVHDRMPVVIDPADYERWLAAGPAEARTLLVPCADDRLRSHRVSPRVNDVRNDDASLIEPLPDESR